MEFLISRNILYRTVDRSENNWQTKEQKEEKGVGNTVWAFFWNLILNCSNQIVYRKWQNLFNSMNFSMADCWLSRIIGR